MDSTVAYALGFAILGAFAGWAWTTVAAVSCGSVWLVLRNTPPKDRWTVWLSIFFNPCPYLIGIVFFGAYAILVGKLSGWFAIGFMLPILFVVREVPLKSPKKGNDDA